MEQKTKAVEEFLNNMAMLPAPPKTPTAMDGIKYAMKMMALADKLFDAGYSAGLTDKTLKDLGG